MAGPLTYTNDVGETVLLGVVSGPGNPQLNCKGAGVYGRVAHPNVLRWIKKNIEDHDST